MINGESKSLIRVWMEVKDWEKEGGLKKAFKILNNTHNMRRVLMTIGGGNEEAQRSEIYIIDNR